MMKKQIAILLIVTFTILVMPMDAIAKATGPTHAGAGYKGQLVNWVTVFNPEGKSLEKEFPLEVTGDNKVVMISIVNLKDMTADVKNVSLTVVTPDGHVIGTEENNKDAASNLRLNVQPELPAYTKIGDELKKMTAVNVKEGKKLDLNRVVSDQDIQQALLDYQVRLMNSSNAGFILFPENRYKNKGLSTLNIANPSQKGTWKIKISGKNSDPFSVTALVFPIQFNQAQAAEELQKAYSDVSERIKNEFPNYHQWCDSCCICNAIIWATGAIATIVGAAAGAVSGGSGAIATIAFYIALVCTCIGLGTVAYAAAFAGFMAALSCNFGCALVNFANYLCYIAGKCSDPNCC